LSTTTILTCIIAPKLFLKIYFLYDFLCAQTCSPWAVFLDYLYELWPLLSALYSELLKKLYRCNSTFSALNYCDGFFSKSLSYRYEVVRTNFSAIFGLFTIFGRNFANIVAPPSDENENCVALLKGITWKPHQNWSINRDRSNYAPHRMHSPPDRSVTEKHKKTNTTFSHLQPARVVRSLPYFAWW